MKRRGPTQYRHVSTPAEFQGSYGNDGSRMVGCFLLVLSGVLLYESVLGVHIGQIITPAFKGIGGYEITAESQEYSTALGFATAMLGLLWCLPRSTRRAVQSAVPRYFCFLRKPLSPIGVRAAYKRTGDPWVSAVWRPHYSIYGSGSIRPIPCYFSQQSMVDAPRIDLVCAFLLRCSTVNYLNGSGIDDAWQHPMRFEKLRSGDCYDRALWAWRKLSDASLDAEFVVGEWKKDASTPGSRHAWVIIHDAAGDIVLEPAGKPTAPMIRALSEARGDYVPYFSIDRRRHEWIYGGYFGRHSKITRRMEND